MSEKMKERLRWLGNMERMTIRCSNAETGRRRERYVEEYRLERTRGEQLRE